MIRKDLFAISWSESLEFLKKQIPEIAWSGTTDNIYNFVISKNPRLSIFSLGHQNFQKLMNQNRLRPLDSIIPNDLTKNYPRSLMSLYRNEEHLLGLPDDIAPYVIAIPQSSMPTNNKFDWQFLRELIQKNKNKSTNEIPFWNGGKINTMGFIFSLLSSNGIDLMIPFAKQLDEKDKWIETYDFLRSLEINWEIFFNEDYRLNWLTTLNTKGSIEFGWLKNLKKNNEDYIEYQILSFPEGPSYNAAKSNSFYIGSSWACPINDIPPEDLKFIIKKITDYEFIKELELNSKNYFNLHKKIWEDPCVRKVKPFYNYANKLLSCSNPILLNITSNLFLNIENTFRIALPQKMSEKSWLDLFLKIDSLSRPVFIDPVIAQAVKFIEDHHADINSLADIAGKINRSSTYLKTTFKSIMGISCWEYVLTIRINHAKKLLSETTLSVKQIGYQIGFNSTPVFINAFKKQTGQTPAKFRKQLT